MTTTMNTNTANTMDDDVTNKIIQNNQNNNKNVNNNQNRNTVRKRSSYIVSDNTNQNNPNDKIIFMLTDKSDDSERRPTLKRKTPHEPYENPVKVITTKGNNDIPIDQNHDQNQSNNHNKNKSSKDRDTKEPPNKKPKYDNKNTENDLSSDDESGTESDEDDFFNNMNNPFFPLFFLNLLPPGPLNNINHNNGPVNPIQPVNPTQSANIVKPIPKMECNNPLCNHKTMEEDPSLPPEITITQIATIDDLITLGKSFHCKKQILYRSLNLRLMCNLVQPLIELRDMIGMTCIKTQMVNQILFFLQGLNTASKCNKCVDCSYNLPCVKTSNTDMLHTVITGPPGVGKTCLARILGKVYKGMGILSKGDFHEVTNTDFKGKYLGHTGDKVKKLVESCKGGVMFIDEAYSLGHEEKRDSFSKEALDTLNKYLTDERDLLCVIAGYEDDLEKCFFSMNEGLRRRFSFKYDMPKYSSKELADIFKGKIAKETWTLDLNSQQPDGKEKYNMNDLYGLFKQYKDSFPFQGGDVETLFLQCKIVHGRRLPIKRKALSYEDIKTGFEQFMTHRKHKKTDQNENEAKRPNMYKV